MARRIDRLTWCPGPYRSCIPASRLDGTKLAGDAAQKANRTLPQIEKLLAEAAAADAAEDARYGDAPGEPMPGGRVPLAVALGRGMRINDHCPGDSAAV